MCTDNKFAHLSSNEEFHRKENYDVYKTQEDIRRRHGYFHVHRT